VADSRNPRLTSKALELARLARSVGVRRLLERVRSWTWSDQRAIRARRPVAPAAADTDRTGLTARPLDRAEARTLLSSGLARASPDERELRIRRLRLVEAGVGQPWLVEVDGRPAYLEWLVLPSANEQVLSFYGGRFSPLAPDEVLGESGYVFPEYRGRAIASRGLDLVLEAGSPPEAKWLVAYIPLHNKANFRNASKAGFAVDAEVRVRWRLGRMRVSVEPWTGDLAVLAGDAPPS
jgi:hypothetical protein